MQAIVLWEVDARRPEQIRRDSGRHLLFDPYGWLTDSFSSQLQYPSLPWVRYITQSGDIAVRLPDVQ